MPPTAAAAPHTAVGSRASRGATAYIAGKPVAVLIALATIVVWGVTGPLFGYSDTWQLVINTGTTIVTFLMVFLIQNTQSRGTMALQIKLDELILATAAARNELVCIEDASEQELDRRRREEKRRSRRSAD